ncbi:hypothetical protein FF2_021827 [Malus domestica]
MLHETRHTQTRELVTPVDINHHLDASQQGGSPSFDMGILDEERVNHQNIDQHETSLNPAAWTRSRRKNPFHICSKINDPRVSERLGPLPRPRPAANLGKERHVLDEHEGTRDSEVFRQTRPRSQYGESNEKSHALAQTFLLPRGDEDLRKKIPVVHDSTQDPLVLQLLEEVNKLKAERQAEMLDWNQPRPGPLTRRILDTPFKRRQNKSLVYNSILEGRTQLNTLTSLSPPWHIGCTPMKSNTDRLHSADDLYTTRQKPDESLREYAGRFSHKYSRCAEADDKTAFKAFTAGLRDCFFKYMINANTWKTYSEVMA